MNEVMNLRGPLSPEDGCTTIIRNSSVFSVRYGLHSHLVAVSRRPGTDSGGPGLIAGQTMDTEALLWYPLAVL